MTSYFFYKNEDSKEKGIVYAKVGEKMNSDYQVTTLDGQEKIIPYQRVRIFVPVHPEMDERLEGFSHEEMLLAKRLENAVNQMNDCQE